LPIPPSPGPGIFLLIEGSNEIGVRELRQILQLFAGILQFQYSLCVLARYQASDIGGPSGEVRLLSSKTEGRATTTGKTENDRLAIPPNSKSGYFFTKRGGLAAHLGNVGLHKQQAN
jgi:hypothetical protein